VRVSERRVRACVHVSVCASDWVSGGINCPDPNTYLSHPRLAT
jgi:hypothetical protein